MAKKTAEKRIPINTILGRVLKANGEAGNRNMDQMEQHEARCRETEKVLKNAGTVLQAKAAQFRQALDAYKAAESNASDARTAREMYRIIVY
jgi:phage shock protein A